jgi:hypothetical protein
MKFRHTSHDRPAANRGRTPPVRLWLEPLEDRTLLSSEQWLLALEGLPGLTIGEQRQAAQALLAANAPDQPVRVIEHTGIKNALAASSESQT